MRGWEAASEAAILGQSMHPLRRVALGSLQVENWGQVPHSPTLVAAEPYAEQPVPQSYWVVTRN